MKRLSLGKWLLIVGIGIVLFSFYGTDKEPPPQYVDISVFLQKVEAGEIVDVTINGADVVGKTKSGSPTLIAAKETDQKLLREVLKDKDVTYRVKIEERGLFSSLLIALLPWVLLIGFWVFLSRRQAQQVGGGLSSLGANKARLIVAESDDTKDKDGNRIQRPKFADVEGMPETVASAQQLVDFLKEPRRFTSLGAKLPRGVLLMGPPGTGKTLLARAIASEAGVPFFSISGSEFVEMLVGMGAARVRSLFEDARKQAPCIIFIDEIDAVARARGGFNSFGGHDEREQTLNQILTEMDGFTATDSVIVLGATNRPEVLDKAIMRPGRFDRKLLVTAPDLKGREAILRVHAKGKPLAEDADLRALARSTAGMTGAELANVLNEAALAAGNEKSPAIHHRHLLAGRDRAMMGEAIKSRVLSPALKRKVAFHEAGHTLLGWLSPHAKPVERVTIIQYGMSLGSTWFGEDDDHVLKSRDQLDAYGLTLLGGRAAEQVIYGSGGITTGASDDLKRMEQLARAMAEDLGMLQVEGISAPRAHGIRETGMMYESRSRNHGEDVQRRLDAAVGAYIDATWANALATLQDNIALLHKLTDALVEKETLEAEEIAELIGPATPRACAA